LQFRGHSFRPDGELRQQRACVGLSAGAGRGEIFSPFCWSSFTIFFHPLTSSHMICLRRRVSAPCELIRHSARRAPWACACFFTLSAYLITSLCCVNAKAMASISIRKFIYAECCASGLLLFRNCHWWRWPFSSVRRETSSALWRICFLPGIFYCAAFGMAPQRDVSSVEHLHRGTVLSSMAMGDALLFEDGGLAVSASSA